MSDVRHKLVTQVLFTVEGKRQFWAWLMFCFRASSFREVRSKHLHKQDDLQFPVLSVLYKTETSHKGSKAQSFLNNNTHRTVFNNNIRWISNYFQSRQIKLKEKFAERTSDNNQPWWSCRRSVIEAEIEVKSPAFLWALSAQQTCP